MKIFQYRVVISLILFALALYFPSFTIDVHSSKPSPYHELCLWPGLKTLLIGWISVFTGLMAWMANPLFFYGITRYKYSMSASILAMFFATTSSNALVMNFPADEAGVREFNISHFNIGFYMWYAAILMMGLGNIWAYLNKGNSDPATI